MAELLKVEEEEEKIGREVRGIADIGGSFAGTKIIERFSSRLDLPVEDESANSSEECLQGKYCDSGNQIAKDMQEATTVSAEDSLVPKVGMRFKSVEEAFLFYTAYGYRTGFGITRRSSHSMHGKKYRQTFTCYKGGNPRVKENVIKCRRKPVVKCGCGAMMVVKDHSLKNLWVVDYVVLKHNHPLDPDRVRFMKCFRELPPVTIKGQVHVDGQAEALFSEAINAVVSKEAGQKISTSNQKSRKLRLGEGDAQALMKYFDSVQGQNPCFFNSWDVDENGILVNVLWVDARSRAEYQYYSDVITFDATYLMSKHNLPLVSFIGVNHHGQYVLLGCGLLGDGTTEFYIWLFAKWLKCMNNKPPNSIIIDHDESIRSAVMKVFPNARIRFCHLQIMRKLPEKLEKMENKEEITIKLRNAVYNSVSLNDFEMEWEEMIERYQLQDNNWFSSLYQDRKQWAPVHIKGTFWAGMSSTQQNEYAISFFEGRVTSKTSIKKFLEQYDRLLREKREKEAQEDFRSFHASPQLISGFEFEKQIANLYTSNMFQKFQDEVRQLIQCICRKIERNGPIVVYMVTELIDNKQLSFQVTFNSIEHEVKCICCSFEFRGILCRHALCVLRQEFVMILPPKYVLPRWRKDFKRLHASNLIPEMASIPRRGSYDELIMCGQQYLLDIALVGAIDRDLKEYALRALKEAKEKVLKYEFSRSDQSVNDDSPSNAIIASNMCIQPLLELQNDSICLASATKDAGFSRPNLKGLNNKRLVSPTKKADEQLMKQRKEDDSSTCTKNASLHVLENQPNVGVLTTQISTQENYSMQVGSDPSPWSLYNTPYFYWHGSGGQDPSRRI